MSIEMQIVSPWWFRAEQELLPGSGLGVLHVTPSGFLASSQPSNNSIVYISHIHHVFISSSVDGQLLWFHFLAIVNSYLAMSIDDHVSLSCSIKSSRYMPRNDSRLISILVYTPTYSMQGLSLPHIDSSIWCLDFWWWSFWLSWGGILKWFWSAFSWSLRCKTHFYLSLIAIILWQLSWFNNQCTWTLFIFLKSLSGGSQA